VLWIRDDVQSFILDCPVGVQLLSSRHSSFEPLGAWVRFVLR